MSIQPRFLDPSKKSVLWPKCERALCHEHFRLRLPEQSLICIFDDIERPEFTASDCFGEDLCGFFIAIRHFDGGRGVVWPQDLMEQVCGARGFLCDAVIYLRCRTCESPTGATITFAHGLQHFLRYGSTHKVWRANLDIRSVIDGNTIEQNSESALPWKMPGEHEAQLFSRRVAEDVLGSGEVQDYAKLQIGKGRDPKKWDFFLGLDLNKPFDLLEETKPLVSRYREDLKRYRETLRVGNPEHYEKGPDYSREKWWE